MAAAKERLIHLKNSYREIFNIVIFSDSLSANQCLSRDVQHVDRQASQCGPR